MSHADADVATVLREDYSVLADAVNGDDARGARAALAEYRRRFRR